MESRSLIAIVALMAMLLTGAEVLADASERGAKPAHRAKPSAPIDVRWLADGSDGRVEVAVATGVDHVGANLRLLLPGSGQPLSATLPAAGAGEVQVVAWTLDRPASRPPRLSITVDTGAVSMTRQVAAPPAVGKTRRELARPEPHADRLEPPDEGAEGASDAQRVRPLARLPAVVTIREAGD
jgi:hypothetical protein